MKRLIWLPVAGFLLIAGATAAAAAPGLLDMAKGGVVAADPSASPSTDPATDEPHLRLGGGLLDEVLADLVDNGTITQAQSDAITQGLQDKADQKLAQMQARRTLIQGFIEDGVITQDEINQLPEDDPLRVAFNSIANDGQISLDQLRGLGPGFGPGFGPGGPGHHGRGFFMWGHDSSPSATGTSS